jgi:hypothetical protein
MCSNPINKYNLQRDAKRSLNMAKKLDPDNKARKAFMESYGK